MEPLTEPERAFLAKHHVSMDEVVDVSHLRPVTWKPMLKPLGAVVAITLGRCARGHRLRNRYGQCVQCAPQYFEFRNRHHRPGHVYVAWALQHELVKIGCAQFPGLRVDELNRRNYASVTDWYLGHEVRCMYAGRVEARAQQILAAYSEPRSYIWGRHLTDCYEVFRCSREEAIAAVNDAASYADVEL